MLRRFPVFAVVAFVVIASLMSAPSANKHSASSQVERPVDRSISVGP